MAGDSWYPNASEYWVPSDEVDAWPLRYGDLSATPAVEQCLDTKGKPWSGVLVLQPSCELGAKASPESTALVARVRPVTSMGKVQRALVRTGWAERDGRILVAHAYTWWMPPAPDQQDDTDWFADFRSTSRVPLGALREAGRTAALTHGGRVHLIRREIYYRFRWVVPVSSIRDLEAERIANDAAFVGPKPNWAT